MARQRHYPDEIQRVHDKAPSKQNTPLQLEIADHIQDTWTGKPEFKRIASELDNKTSSETVRKVHYAFFGPAEDPLDRSFNEIIKDVQTELNQPDLSDTDALEEYWKARGELPGETELDVPDIEADQEDEQAVPEDVRNDIYHNAVQETYQRAFEEGRQSVLEDLPDELVLEYFGRSALEHKQADNR